MQLFLVISLNDFAIAFGAPHHQANMDLFHALQVPPRVLDCPARRERDLVLANFSSKREAPLSLLL